jgi:hypothetical protein
MDTLAMMQVSLGVEPPPAPYDDLRKREAVAGTPSYVSASVRDSLRKKRALYTINSMIVQKIFPLPTNSFSSLPR